MKPRTRCVLSTVLALALASGAAAADPISWRGTLQDGAAPADGTYAFEVRLHASQDSAAMLAAPIRFGSVSVRNGQFELPLEVPAELAARPQLWLQVAVKGPGDTAFEVLPQRVAAKSAGAMCWNTAGNAATSSADFLGTIDNQGLFLRANNRRVGLFAFVPTNQTESPSVILGHENNLALNRGAVVGGGGSQAFPNLALSNYGTLAGGYGNQSGAVDGSQIGTTVSGGFLNKATGGAAAVGGGRSNEAQGKDSVVSGGVSNLASGEAGSIGGGSNNEVLGRVGVIAGGENNTVGELGTVGGGDLNEATGALATIPGGRSNKASGQNSLAAGQNARALHLGSFVWSDGSGGAFASLRPYQMRIRAAGGIHMQGEDALGVNAAALGNTDPVELVLESADAQAYLMSDNAGSFGSVLALGEMNNNSLVNTWAIARETSAGGNGLRFAFGTDPVAATNTVRVKFNSNGTVFKSSGSASWDVVSDARLKTELGPLEHALDRLLRLRGVRFAYHRDARPYGMALPEGEQIGFIAQEVQQVFPEWVSTGDDGMLSIGERGTTALVVEALRELSIRNAQLEAELDRRNAQFEARLAALEARIR